MLTNPENRRLRPGRPEGHALTRVAVAALLAASVSACRERPGKLELEPEQDDRPGPRIVTVPYTVAKLPARPPSPVDYSVVRRDDYAAAQQCQCAGAGVVD